MMPKNYHNTRFKYDKKRGIIWKAIAGYLQRFVDRDSRVLDIGAGYCTFINNIEAKEKHALDLFEELPNHAQKGVTAHVQSSTSMKNFASGYFDVVFASNFFEHLDSKDFSLTIGEIKRILKKGARLIILQPNFKYCFKEYFDDYTHEKIYTDMGMCNLLESFGLSIEKCVPAFLPFSLKARLPKSALLMKIYLRLPFKPFAKQMLIIASKK